MSESTNSTGKQAPSSISRRRFIAGTGASALTFTILKPQLARGALANSKIDLGLIGCGNRGTWIAELFQKHGGYNIVGLADYFPDRVAAAGEKFKVPTGQQHTGLSGFRKLLEQRLDAVVIESPPYFHPEHAAAAIEAGKHVYLAKPVGVDVPGCLSVAESGRRASANKLCFLVDFQTRANELYQEAARRVQAGELGRIISVEASYETGATWEPMDQLLRKDPANPEVRLRAWGIDRLLSGDIITEQNIHALDVACWMLDAQPLRAYGAGGRTRNFLGDCWDHFEVIFYYPNDVVVSFNSHQAGFGYDDILCRIYGLKGTADTHYFGKVTLKTTEFHSDGEVGNLYTDGVMANIATFFENIRQGEWSNPTVAASVRSNLTAILGRMSAYKNGVVTWGEMMETKEKFLPDLQGLKV